ncbi:MAG: alanine--glyoxylate aminotransferase family protein [Planctomycetes bacterium]|nr:alanine--glyoxylate aminotransferase family protein [Planctomycetota bacterium]
MNESVFHDPSSVLLLGPGPSPVSDAVRAAMAAPVLGHLDPEFVQLMDRVQGGLRTLYGTENRFTLPISGTGSAGMEAAVVNLVEPGDRVVVGIHGVFGGRMRDLVERQGGEAVVVEVPFGEPLDPDAMAEAIAGGDTKVVGLVHAETSTGVLQPLAEIVGAARAAGALVVLDCVTSLGGVPVELDRLGVDAAYSGTQKCLSVPPGLAPLSFSERAFERIRSRAKPSTSWYLDAGLLSGYWGEGQRAYHHTAPISMIYGLAAGLDAALGEGLEERFARHADAAQRLHRGLEVLGLECLVPVELRTPMLTSVCVPDGVDELAVRKRLRQLHGIEIGGGLGSLAGRVWRIGLMGHGARPEVVQRLLAALGESLGSVGFRCDVGAAMSTASV